MFDNVTGGISFCVGGLKPASDGRSPVLIIGGWRRVEMALGLDSTVVGALLVREKELVVELLCRSPRRRPTSWTGNGYCASGDGAEGEWNVSGDGRKLGEFILGASITICEAIHLKFQPELLRNRQYFCQTSEYTHKFLYLEA